MARKLFRYLIIFAILGGAVVGAAVMVKMKPPPEKKDVVERAVLVDVLPLAAASVDFSVSSQGNVRPRTETVIGAELSGTIVSVADNFVAGGVFAKNEILMRIDPTNYQVAVEQAKALLDQRQIEFDGARRLKEKGYRAEADLASAAAALASANAGVVRARRDLERTFIRLPYDGMVKSKAADVGQYVSPGVRLGVTFATDFAEVRLPITDRDLAFLELPDAHVAIDTRSVTDHGLPVTLTAMRRGENQSWLARIVRTEGVVDETTRVTYAVARVDDPYRLGQDATGPTLPVGTFVRAQIDGISIDNVIRVPRAALRGSNQLLFVDSTDQLRIRSVRVLRRDAEFAYLDGGADAGERISLTAIEAPVNGMKVRVNGRKDDTRHADADDEEDSGSDADAKPEGGGPGARVGSQR